MENFDMNEKIEEMLKTGESIKNLMDQSKDLKKRMEQERTRHAITKLIAGVFVMALNSLFIVYFWDMTLPKFFPELASITFKDCFIALWSIEAIAHTIFGKRN